MSNVIKWHQFLLGDTKKPNFIIQYYATKQIHFLFGKLKKFYITNIFSNEIFGKGELIYDKYDENTSIGEYALYVDDINSFSGGFIDKNDESATIMGCIDLCYDSNDANNYINTIDEDIIVILPNSIKYLTGPISAGGRIILDYLPENLETIENYGLDGLKSDGLVIPQSVKTIDKCFNISAGPVTIDNLYFISEFPPNLTEGNIGFDQDIFHEDIKLQICIPIESKDRYLNSDFINHEGRLNFNRIIQDVTTVKVLDNNNYKTIYNKQLYLNDITSVRISSSSNPNESITLPNSVENLKIFINRISSRTKFNNVLTITSDIKNIEWTNNNSQLRTLFAKYSEIQFIDGCTTIPDNLISSTYQTGNYDDMSTGYWYNKLVIDKNVKNINQIFTYNNNSTDVVMLYFIVLCNYEDFWVTLCNLNHPEGGAFSKLKQVNLYKRSFGNLEQTEYKEIDLVSNATYTKITRVNDYAFTNMNMNGAISLGRNIKFIGKKAFKVVGRVTSVIYHGTSIDSWFRIEMPSSLDENYEENCAFNKDETFSYQGTKKDNFVVTDGVEIFNSNLNGFDFTTISINCKIINQNTLNNCSYLRYITLGTNVSEIKGQFTKDGNISCTYLGTINDYYRIKGFDLNLGSVLTTKDHENNDTFSVEFDNTITEIDNRLQYKSGGTSLRISESIETIHEYAFNSWSPQYITIYADIINQFKSTTLKYTSIQYLNLGTNITNITNIFKDCTNLKGITYNGTIEQWNAITKAEDWNENIPVTIVNCSDGTVTIRETT